MKIGVLDIQGDVSEHFEITKKAFEKLKLDAEVLKVRNTSDVLKCDGIIISGGESTVIGKIMEETNIKSVIKDQDIPIMGTCAGMILLASETDYKQPLLGLIEIKVKRNGFGRQKNSFEKEIMILGAKFKGVFIRAPYVEKIGKNVEVMAKIKEKVVAVQEGKNIAIAFHPELTGDTRVHEYFIKEVLKCAE
jgi:pyridoxal 5'-phosphate synthase pdxT subunit